MKHSVHLINSPNNTARIHSYVRQQNGHDDYSEIVHNISFKNTGELSKSKIRRQVQEIAQRVVKDYQGIVRCYNVVIFQSKDMEKQLSIEHLKEFRQHREQLKQHSGFFIHRLLEHESITELPISKQLHMSQLMFLIARYSAPGVTLSSLTKQEAASRLNLKATQLNNLLSKLIKAELITTTPFSFIAPTEKYWDSGCLNKLYFRPQVQRSPVEINEIKESVQRFISDFNALKIHNLYLSYENRAKALKDLPSDIRVFFLPTLTHYVQNIKTRVLTIERGW
ncbi:hypothetical protein AB4431_02290 [Vibrio artabrorum]|uniref:hypothetical protein n=1 Tax=Vibrio artabrorum TaxID=446374 RepID=UPI00354DA2D7